MNKNVVIVMSNPETGKRHIVIFSHGFGVLKDSRGLFTELAAMLSSHGIESVLFDYNEIRLETNEVVVKPFSEQAKILQQVIEETRAKSPDSVIDIIAHSQGCLIPALMAPLGIRKTIALAPSLSNSVERMVEYFQNRPGSVIDMDGISKLSRRDGSTTLVPAGFWLEKKSIDPLVSYNKFAKHTEFTMVIANQDEVIGKEGLNGLNPYIAVIHCDGDHDFTGESRKPLMKIVEDIIIRD